MSKAHYSSARWCPAPSAWINESSLPPVESTTNPEEIYWETLLKRDKILIGILSRASILSECAVVQKEQDWSYWPSLTIVDQEGLYSWKFWPLLLWCHRCIGNRVVMSYMTYVLKIDPFQKQLWRKPLHWTIAFHQTRLNGQTVTGWL